MSERNIVGIVDAGGRGATLARMYERSPHVDGVVVIPGNDMIQAMAQKPTSVFTDIDISRITTSFTCIYRILHVTPHQTKSNEQTNKIK